MKNIFIVLRSSEKQALGLLTLADTLISVLDIVFLLVLLYLVNFFTQPVQLVSYKGVSLSFFNEHPLLFITLFFLLFAAKNAAGFLVARQQVHFVYKVASRLSGELLSHYLHGSYEAYASVDSSVPNRAIGQQPVEFAHYVLNGLQQVVSQAVLVFITALAIFMLNLVLFPLLVILLAPPVWLAASLMKRALHAARLHGKKASEQSMQHLQEALQGFVDSNVYTKNNFFVDRYRRVQAQLNRYLATRLVVQYMPPRLMEVFAVFGLLLLVMINFIVAHDHSIRLVTIGALMVAAYKIIPGIAKITNAMGQVKSYAGTAADLAASMHPATVVTGNAAAIQSISFNKISFDYPAKQVLASFSACLQKGDFAVVNGPSGKGKTTLVHLLLGFLTPASGTIYLNGCPACTDTRRQYWSQTAYAKQQGFFLHASILENIILDAKEYDHNKISNIIARTGIDKMVQTFPDGLQTLVTENGRNFSGGQRQRILFARALYKDASLLILDEPFNELDELSERIMLTELQHQAATGKIVMLITHNNAALAFGNKKMELS